MLSSSLGRNCEGDKAQGIYDLDDGGSARLRG